MKNNNDCKKFNFFINYPYREHQKIHDAVQKDCTKNTSVQLENILETGTVFIQNKTACCLKCGHPEHTYVTHLCLLPISPPPLYLRPADKSSSSSVVKQGAMEQREGPRGRWTPCHVELTPCELRLYTLDSSANRQLGTAYSLSHCQSVISPAPSSQPGQITQPADQRTLQALFFNSTRLQLRAANQWEAMEWRRLMWEKVQAARPVRQENRQRKTGVENQQVAKFPAPMSPSSSPSPSGLDTRPDGESDTSTSAEASLSLQPNSAVLSRPTTLPLFTQRCQDVLKAGLLHQLMDQNNWRAFTFVLTRSALRAFPTEGRGSVSQPLFQYSLASCLAVQHDQELENGEPWTDRGGCFKVVFPKQVLRLRADDQLKAQEWVEALREAVGAQKPAQEEGGESGEGTPGLQGVLLRSKPSRERRQREAQRAKRQSVTTSFLSILTCLAVEKGLTAQSFKCAGKMTYTHTHTHTETQKLLYKKIMWQ